MPFLTTLQMERTLGHWRRWRLLDPLLYQADDASRYEVPAGFHTDGASVPRGLWNVFPKYGKYLESAVLHDWLYASACLTRRQADKLFKEAMKSQGVGRFRRACIYAGVRTGGWGAWRKHRKQDHPDP